MESARERWSQDPANCQARVGSEERVQVERNCCFLDVWSVLCEGSFAWYPATHLECAQRAADTGERRASCVSNGSPSSGPLIRRPFLGGKRR